MSKKTKFKNLPQVGVIYHFWDDGKTSASRHYLAKVEELIPIGDAARVKVENIYQNLLNVWVNQKKEHYWIYSQETDYIVRCSIPCYDDDPIYFARTKDGGWFSMDVTGWWQGGRLDITGEIYKSVIDDCVENGYDVSQYENEKYEKDV